MGLKNVISLSAFVLVLFCWALFFQSNFLAYATLLLAPIFGLTGFFFAIAAIRARMHKAWSWTLFALNGLVLLVYLAGAVYMAFFWHPRFF